MMPHDDLPYRIRRAKLLLSGGTLLLYGLSFFKSQLMAVYFGTSAEVDAYALALTPSTMIGGILIGTIQAVLIPQYHDIRSRQGESKALSAFVSSVAWILAGLLFFSIGAWIGSDRLMVTFGVGFSPSQIHFAASILRYSLGILAISVFCESGRYFFDIHRRFHLSASVPLISAVASLIYLVAFRRAGLIVFVQGLLIGLFLQSIVTWWYMRRVAPFPFRWLPPTDPTLTAAFVKMLPLLCGASFGHINTMVDQIMASTLPAGSISALYYAFRLHALITQITITVMTQAVFPFLCQQVAERNFVLLRQTYRQNLTQILMIVIPLTLGVLLLGTKMVQFTFEHGMFSNSSTTATANAWMAYALGMPAQAVRDLTIKMLYAFQENTIVMYFHIGSIVLNILFNWMLMTRFSQTGIALSTSIVYMLTSAMFVIALQKTLKRHEQNAVS